MNSFFADLKHAREAKGISLGEISDATLISQKMLEALENGNDTIVPQAYLRAFIREYAAVIGLDKNETMKKYDAWLMEKEGSSPAAETRQTKVPESLPKVPPEPTAERSADKIRRLMPTFFKIGIAVMVLVLVDIVLWSVLERESTHTVQERPFRDVIREQEERLNLPDSARVSNVRSAPALRAPTYSSSDSMVLVATTSDTVWMEIVTDDEILTEHLFPPKSSFAWKAKNEFWISAIGNPNGITFTLNGKPIVHPIRKGFVTRDVRLTRDSLNTRR
jgi:cytoskeletal protein RodZ